MITFIFKWLFGGIRRAAIVSVGRYATDRRIELRVTTLEFFEETFRRACGYSGCPIKIKQQSLGLIPLT